MSKNKLFILATIVALVVAGLRIFQFTNFYSVSTGFFTDNGICSYLGIILVCAVAIFSFFKSKKVYKEMDSGGNIYLGAITIFCGLISSYGAFVMYNHYVQLQNSGMKDVSAMGFSLRLPFLIATIVAALIYFVYGFLLIKNQDLFKRIKLLPIISVIWSIILILYVFIHYSISVLITENIFVIFSACLLALAFMNIAKFLTGINSSGACYKNLITSCVAAYTIVIAYSISSFVNYGLGLISKNEPPINLLIILFAAGTFVGSFMALVKTKSAPEPQKEVEGKRFVSNKYK